EEFGKDRRSWFKLFLDLPYGIPVEDTYRRVFAILDPKEFQKRFSRWIQATVYIKSGTVIAIDGKTMRGCKGKGVKPKHIVNAWNSVNRVTLGQWGCLENDSALDSKFFCLQLSFRFGGHINQYGPQTKSSTGGKRTPNLVLDS